MLTVLLFSKLNFTGMGGPMGVYEGYDTDICDDGGRNCVARDNEGYYGKPFAALGSGKCPAAFDCVGVPPEIWHPLDGVTNAEEYIE